MKEPESQFHFSYIHSDEAHGAKDAGERSYWLPAISFQLLFAGAAAGVEAKNPASELKADG